MDSGKKRENENSESEKKTRIYSRKNKIQVHNKQDFSIRSQLKALSTDNVSKMARQTGFKRSTLYDILNGIRDPTLKELEILEKNNYILINPLAKQEVLHGRNRI